MVPIASVTLSPSTKRVVTSTGTSHPGVAKVMQEVSLVKQW